MLIEKLLFRKADQYHNVFTPETLSSHNNALKVGKDTFSATLPMPHCIIEVQVQLFLTLVMNKDLQEGK